MFVCFQCESRGELLASLSYQPVSHRLSVVVLKARHLPKMDITGLSASEFPQLEQEERIVGVCLVMKYLQGFFGLLHEYINDQLFFCLCVLQFDLHRPECEFVSQAGKTQTEAFVRHTAGVSVHIYRVSKKVVKNENKCV